MKAPRRKNTKQTVAQPTAPAKTIALKHIPLGGKFDNLAFCELVFGGREHLVEALRVSREIQERIERLKALAEMGDRQAARAILRHVHDTVRWFNESDTAGARLVQSLAPERPMWPELLNAHPKAIKETIDHLAKLKLGSQSGYNVSPRSKAGQGCGGRMSAAWHCALIIKQTLQQNQHQLSLARSYAKRFKLKFDYTQVPKWAKDCETLPPLTKAKAKDWWGLGRKAFLEAIPNPQDDEQLCRLVVTKQREQRVSWYPSDFREKILDKIWKTFRALAAVPVTAS